MTYKMVDHTSILEDRAELERIIKEHTQWSPAPTSHDDYRLYFLVLAMAGEAGECLNLIKKEWRGDAGRAQRRAKLCDELADVSAYLRMVASHLGIDLDKAVLSKVKEVEQRKEYKKAMKKIRKK